MVQGNDGVRGSVDEVVAVRNSVVSRSSTVAREVRLGAPCRWGMGGVTNERDKSNCSCS